MKPLQLDCRKCGAPFPDHAADCPVKLRRRIEEMLRKFATPDQLLQVAGILGITHG